jgi:hypothetical protein
MYLTICVCVCVYVSSSVICSFRKYRRRYQINENGTCGTCSMHGKDTSAYTILAGNPKRKIPLGRSGCRWQDDNKTGLSERGVRVWAELNWLSVRPSGGLFLLPLGTSVQFGPVQPASEPKARQTATHRVTVLSIAMARRPYLSTCTWGVNKRERLLCTCTQPDGTSPWTEQDGTTWTTL